MNDLSTWHDACRERIHTNMLRHGLSERECEVAWLLFTTWTTSDIGEELDITKHTVNEHYVRIALKLGLPVQRAQRVPILVRLLNLEGLSSE